MNRHWLVIAAFGMAICMHACSPAEPSSASVETAHGLSLYKEPVRVETDNDLSFVLAPPNTNLYDIAYDDVEIAGVVREFMGLEGVNIIAAPGKMQGRVTVSLSGVPWKPALESILDMQGYIMIEKRPESRVYAIVERVGDIAPMTTEVMHFSDSKKAEDFAKSTKELWGGSPQFRIAAVPSFNAVIVETTELYHYQLKYMAERLQAMDPSDGSIK